MSADQSLQHMPMEVILQQVIHPARQQMVGEKFRIAHLKSARGAELNNKVCLVTGFDRSNPEARLHCYVLNNEGKKTGESVKLKSVNLIPEDPASKTLDSFMGTSSKIPDKVLKSCLQTAIRRHGGPENFDREDAIHRLKWYKDLLKKLRNLDPKKVDMNNNNLRDEDYTVPCAYGMELLGSDNFSVLMKNMKLACVGNEVLDIRHMDIGLKGDGTTECAVCQEILNETEDVQSKSDLVTLPCMHVFHKKCVVSWLESDLGTRNWNCPSCRSLVPFDLSTYLVHYKQQLQTRFNEFPLSGFCTKCMIWTLERNRNDSLGVSADDGTLQHGCLGITADKRRDNTVGGSMG